MFFRWILYAFIRSHYPNLCHRSKSYSPVLRRCFNSSHFLYSSLISVSPLYLIIPITIFFFFISFINITNWFLLLTGLVISVFILFEPSAKLIITFARLLGHHSLLFTSYLSVFPSWSLCWFSFFSWPFNTAFSSGSGIHSLFYLYSLTQESHSAP